MKMVPFEEFERLVKEDFRRDYRGYRPIEEINEYLDNDEDAKDCIEGGYEEYTSGMFSEGMTAEAHLQACVSTASYNAGMFF